MYICFGSPVKSDIWHLCTPLAPSPQYYFDESTYTLNHFNIHSNSLRHHPLFLNYYISKTQLKLCQPSQNSSNVIKVHGTHYTDNTCKIYYRVFTCEFTLDTKWQLHKHSRHCLHVSELSSLINSLISTTYLGDGDK